MGAASGDLQFLHRPYPYSRNPFQVESGELVGYEGRYFSIPAFGLLLDKRLFTAAASHPVASTIKLYVNKDAAESETIEPSLAASGYERGTPHYNEVVTDIRDLLDDVVNLHADDSPHTGAQFFQAHMARNRKTYVEQQTNASGVSDGVYVHPAPTNTVPSGATPPGASGSIPPPGDGHELGAQQLQDVDIDEIQWQPFTRPKDFDSTTIRELPHEPIFPMALPGGTLPTFSDLDKSSYNDLALGAATSGGIIITGDALIDGTSIKLLTGSGMTGALEGTFRQNVPWKLFPCKDELCRYYETDTGLEIINASGRQAIYNAPSSSATNKVLLLDVSTATESGIVIQTYPANYYATSGVDQDGVAHGGVHNVDKLIYNLTEMAPGQPVVGRSPINGKKVFAHFAGTETDSGGRDIGNASFKYANGDTIRGGGNVTDRNITTQVTRTNWASTGKTMSPISWSSVSSTQQGVAFLPFTRDPYNTYHTADINHSAARILSVKRYGGWGFVDQVVSPDQDFALGGQRTTGVINYLTKIYRGIGIDANGRIIWKEEPNSPSTHSTQIVFYQNTFFVNNIFSFFFYRKVSRGLVSVNGDVHWQWSPRTLGSDTIPRANHFASFDAKTFALVPLTNRKEVRISIGFFPAWKVLRYIITNNQITVPRTIQVSPAKSIVVTFHPDLDFDSTFVEEYGPAVWDATAGVNYIYFTVRPVPGLPARGYFAKMDTGFQIIEFNAVDATDLILNGRAAVLTI